MSYILDALRRAEADRERERGQVPGLHAQPLPVPASAAGASPRRWLPWAGGGLLLLAGIGAGSWWAGETPPAVPQTQTAPMPASAPATLPAPPAPPAATVAAAPAPVPTTVSAPVPTPAVSESPYLAPVPPPAATPAPAPAPVAAAAPAPEDRIPRLAELPEGTRRELPRLTISGSVYSDDPASRFVMINGEVQREGARLGAELVLEQIRPRELVLRFKGQRFRQPV
ncbi:general secretion pathway protein GspB [Roseateles sp. DC23W]|uniref:General secretion pathway protein GspB n=1 Tax=Pelomonas dachongensis TaxID=3299029 RepID=A0ABW7EPS8_9BURK